MPTREPLLPNTDAYVEDSSLAFSPDGQHCGIVGLDATLRLWCLEREELIRQISIAVERVYGIVFSPDGRQLASGGEGGAIQLWAVETGECCAIIQTPRLYEAMNITGVQGLTADQKAAMMELGAIVYQGKNPSV